LQTKAETILGEKVPRKKEEGKDWTWVAVILIALLILKGFGILKALFNIDPEGITFNIDLGYITSAGLFIYVLTRLHKLNDVLSKQGERIAKIEGILSTKQRESSSVSE
jgi:uncharacterized protein YpmS